MARRQFVPDCVSLASYGVMMVNQHSSTIWLVFRCGHEYVFTHEESTAIVTVTLSTTLLIYLGSLVFRRMTWRNMRQNGRCSPIERMGLWTSAPPLTICQSSASTILEMKRLRNEPPEIKRRFHAWQVEGLNHPSLDIFDL